MIILAVYVAIFVGSFVATKFLVHKTRRDFTSLKTVTFGDESAVTPNRVASVVSILTLFLIWGSFTGSKLLPSFLHAPGPFTGEAELTYTLEAEDGSRDDATIKVLVYQLGADVAEPAIEPGDGFAKNDGLTMASGRSTTIIFDKNDEITRKMGAKVVAVDGKPIGPGQTVSIGAGTVSLSDKGAIQFAPPLGLQMDPIWLPAPESVVSRFLEILNSGYRGSTLLEHLGYSLFRVVVGFICGAIVGIPLGYAMGLSDWFRGWFDPIVEFMRPVPPLALIPLVIIWAGIGETGKIILLFLAALWIMAIAARSGVSGVRITKIHAAYSLGATKPQIMRHVIVPNSLPDIFTGARVAMGVCWGTVVAAELVAAEKGAGMMIMVASKFQLTDIVIMGIILIGLIGFGIDILMRMAEKWLVPWKGRA
ncbi:ABC transporter permease subunit [Defluviimonas sp. WL0050]|uniref:ABC transporter permease subunit n=1 Tax=Albidovulum litorale TaxID=2984134 RepID=A0ABT2ZJ92_9RHOB|nr:ABC transporter permease subunit [Defluviimonas sp. WL0050]MCV2871194.1 ABC transporter permease subunit [Defluviimonas sp. WL0050]